MKSSLVELIEQYPDLPIFALVDYEVVGGDEANRWYGQLGMAITREYANVEEYGYNNQTIVFKDDTEDYEQWLIDGMLEDQDVIVTEEIAEEEAKEIIENLEYKKAIFVNVDLPDKLLK